MPNSFDKVIELIQKTGDNCIVLDATGNPAYVVSQFDKYYEAKLSGQSLSGLSNLSETQLINRINDDVAAWKAGQKTQELDNWSEIDSSIESVKKELINPFLAKNSLNVAEKDNNTGHSEAKYYFEPID